MMLSSLLKQRWPRRLDSRAFGTAFSQGQGQSARPITIAGAGHVILNRPQYQYPTPRQWSHCDGGIASSYYSNVSSATTQRSSYVSRDNNARKKKNGKKMRHRDRPENWEKQNNNNNQPSSKPMTSNGRQKDGQGHNYSQVGEPIDPNICLLTENEIHNLIRERMQCRRNHKFEAADGILKELNKYGVNMDDKSKEWWASRKTIDARQIIMSSNKTTNGATHNTGVNEFGHEYTQIGGPIDPSSCSITEDSIHGLIRNRMQYRRSRDFEKADSMRDELNRCGVQVDDTMREWRADGAGMRGRREQVLNEFGHDYTRVGGGIDTKICGLSEEEIHDLIRERMTCRMARGFHKADTILQELQENGVDIDDKTKEWRADGVFVNTMDAPAFPNSEDGDSEDAAVPRTPSPVMKNFTSLEEAIGVSYEHLETLTTRDISAFWAVLPQFLEQRDASFAERNPQAAAQLGNILARTLEDMNAFDYRDLTTTTLGLAKIVKSIESRADDSPRGGPHRTLHGILIGDDSKNKQIIFGHIARSSASALEEFQFDARCLANLSYAYAIADYVPKLKDGGTLLDHLAKDSISQLGSFKPQGLANMLWAHATLGVSNSDLFEEAADTIMELLGWESFKPQDLSKFVWAYATLDEEHPVLFEKIADHIVALDDDAELFHAQGCADVVWAYATLGVSHPKLFKKFAGQMIKLDNLHAFKPQDLSKIASAYATAREPHPKLLRKIADAVIKRRDEFDSEGLATLLHAYATAGVIDQQLLSASTQTIASSLSECTGQELAMIAWAYAVADVATPPQFIDEFIKTCLEEKDEFTPEGLCELHQWNLWQEEVKSDIKLPPSLEEKCRDAFVTLGPKSSAMQEDVIAELSNLGLEVEEKVLTQSGYWLDALVEANRKKLGVVFDEPSSFVGRKATGSTILKRRQVANLDGIEIVSVPYWKWRELGVDDAEKQQYLRTLLKLV